MTLQDTQAPVKRPISPECFDDTPEAGAQIRSVCKHSYLEALRYKWIASEKAGRDLGDGAILEWLNRHWPGWCRARWLEHVTGITCWAEFDPRAFGSLLAHYDGDPVLLDRVLDRARCGWENLDIIIWAADWKLDVDAIIEVLTLLDINRARLDPARLFDPSST